ncbi:hypothetical protein OROGR_029767 [Orobanche gracilis]
MVNFKNVFVGIFFASILLMICSQSEVTAKEPAETSINNTMKEIHTHAAEDEINCQDPEYCCIVVNRVCTKCCSPRIIDCVGHNGSCCDESDPLCH